MNIIRMGKKKTLSNKEEITEAIDIHLSRLLITPGVN